MGAIIFDIEEYRVRVSTHGYFGVLSKTLPSAKFSDLPGELYGGPVTELGHGIHWDGEHDDVVPDVEDPIVERACQEWVASHRTMLAEAAVEAAAEWERRAAEPVMIYGHPFRVGQMVAITNRGRSWSGGRLLSAVADRGGTYTVHMQKPDGGVSSVCVGCAGNGIEPVDVSAG